jgi:hypothetical protein
MYIIDAKIINTAKSVQLTQIGGSEYKYTSHTFSSFTCFLNREDSLKIRGDINIFIDAAVFAI